MEATVKRDRQLAGVKNILGQPDRGLVGVDGVIQRCRRS